jgi:hypothetical protein
LDGCISTVRIPFCKAAIRSVIDRIEGDDDAITNSAEKANLERMIAERETGSARVRSFRSES